MINCQQLIDFCLDYIEGALPDDDERGFRRHLERCPDCVTFFDTYRKTREVSREALATRMPPAVHEAVRSFLRARREP